MECVEVVNTTDHDVDLNNEYQFGYEVKEGSRKILDVSRYDENTESGIGSSDNCVIPAGKTAASGDGGKPGLPAAGREAAVNADKENRMMYNPAVRCIFTSCVNRDGSKRSTGGANQD